MCWIGTMPFPQCGTPVLFVVVGSLCFSPELLPALIEANETSVTAANAKAAIATPISSLDFMSYHPLDCCAFEWLKFGHST
jgi:hypothetical protein